MNPDRVGQDRGAISDLHEDVPERAMRDSVTFAKFAESTEKTPHMSDHPERWDRLAAALNDAMRDRNWYQADLVRASGVSDVTIRGILNNEPHGRPRAVTLRKLAKAVGWTEDSIGVVLAGGDPVSELSAMTAQDVLAELVELRREIAELSARLGRRAPGGRPPRSEASATPRAPRR